MNISNKLKYFIAGFFLFNLLISSVFANDIDSLNEKYVLVLHSYHQGLEWTDNISDGIKSVLGSKTNVNLIFEYLDTKRNFNNEYYEALKVLYEVKANQITFDIIIASDNAAYNFLRKHSEEFYPGVPVVFCGVNNLDTDELKNYPMFHGFAERADHKGTIEAIQHIFPDRKNVLIINDETLTGKAILEELKEVLPLFDAQLNFEIYTDFSISDVMRKVDSLDDSYVIYLLVFNRDNNNEFISYSKGITKINSVNKVPIFGSWDFYENRGLFGGKIIHGFDQGLSSALMAEDIMKNGLSDNLKQDNDSEIKYFFDYNQMMKFDIAVDQLPENSTILNLPVNEDRLIIISMFISYFLLFAVLILSVIIFIKKKRTLKLQKLVEEKTIDLSQANTKLEVIIEKNKKFFSILAHDLRNYIGALVNASILLNNTETVLDKNREQILKRELYLSANKTSGLLEDLLFWGMNQFERHPEATISNINISTMLKSLAEIYRINQGKIEFILDIPDDIMLLSDEQILKFIFRNIIQNAVKYSLKNGHVKISCEKRNKDIIVKISDEGIGMTPEIVESIYSKNPILQKGTFNKKNSGLGLPTVLEYLELLNGQIQIESVPDKGSTIFITLTDQSSNP